MCFINVEELRVKYTQRKNISLKAKRGIKHRWLWLTTYLECDTSHGFVSFTYGSVDTAIHKNALAFSGVDSSASSYWGAGSRGFVGACRS